MFGSLVLRRLRRSLRVWWESKKVCTMCGCAVERFAVVCDEEACQLRALADQAMLATAPYESPSHPRRVKRSRMERADSPAAGASIPA